MDRVVHSLPCRSTDPQTGPQKTGYGHQYTRRRNDQVREGRGRGKETGSRGKLQYLKKQIEQQQQGVYGKYYQDPVLLATLLPTGIYGIVLVLFRTFYG